MIKTALSGLVLVLLSACASGPGNGSQYTYNKIEVANNSDQLIQQLTIKLTDIGALTECGDIAALGLCSERFGRRTYSQAPFIVDWTFGDKARQTDVIEIAVPAYFVLGNSLYVAIEISPEGMISASLMQNTPP